MSPTDKADVFAGGIVSRITEGNTKETFEAHVLDVAADLREFARSLLIEPLDRIEKHADAIYVRERIDGETRNVSLLQLPIHLAIQHICRMLRSNASSEPGKRE